MTFDVIVDVADDRRQLHTIAERVLLFMDRYKIKDTGEYHWSNSDTTPTQVHYIPPTP